MIIVPATGPVTKGMDLFHGNRFVDFFRVQHSGYSFCYLKAWEFQADPTFKFRWKDAKTAGLIRGAYDFFHPRLDPIEQAKAFLEIIGPMDDTDLPPMLDWEVTDGMMTQADRDAAYAWLGYVKAQTNKNPVIYASPYFLYGLILEDRFKEFNFCVAEYGVKAPKVPEPWKSWDFWQTSETGVVDGVSGAVDLELFNGDLDALKAFVQKNNG